MFNNWGALRRPSVWLSGMAGMIAGAFLIVFWPSVASALFTTRGLDLQGHLESFEPHGHCYLWLKPLLWLHAASDFSIGLSYVAISLMLVYLVFRARRDVPFHWLFLAFGTFIIACGATHFVEVWITFFNPVYWLAGYVKLVTAVASVFTALVLPGVIPRALDVVEAARISNERRAQLEQANSELEILYARSRDNEAALQLAREELEHRVLERTSALAQANNDLQFAKEEAETAKDEAELARERAERADAAKSEFLSRISHELRTPLNAIIGFGQLLEMQESQLSRQQNEGVRHILKAGDHLLGLVNEILDITRIDSPDSDLALEPVNLGEIVSQALDMTQTLAAKTEISVISQVPAASAVFVLADRQRLLQIALNLLSNAIKYNRLGGTVTLSCEKGDGRVRLNVTDTGYGIADEDLPQLFVPFSRLKAESRGVEGTGLGLVLCQRLAGAMNGSLNVHSRIEVGSTFSLELPIASALVASAPLEVEVEQAAPQFVAPKEKPLVSEPLVSEPLVSEPLVSEPLVSEPLVSEPLVSEPLVSEPAQKTVLLIEDNISNFQLIETVMKHLGEVRLVGAMQGGAGVEMAQRELPDLILLDLHLPDMMGDEVMRRLQALPETQNVPVIVLSADATPGQIARLLSQGALQYLTKPLDMKVFLHTVKETLGLR